MLEMKFKKFMEMYIWYRLFTLGVICDGLLKLSDNQAETQNKNPLI